MKGNITRRGKRSWRIKFDIGIDHLTGKRQTRYVTVQGTKKEAETEAAKIIAGLSAGTYVEGSKETVAQFVERWLADWATGNTSPKTLERYGQLLRLHVARLMGATPIQKVNASTLQSMYATLIREGLAPRTTLHVHRVVHRMLRHAAQWGVVHSNAASLVDAPTVTATEIDILTSPQVKHMLVGFKVTPLYAFTTLALGTGMRRGELLALRWQDINLDGAVLQVERSLEQTKAGGLRFKPPKTKYGRRSIPLPATTVAELRAHRRVAQELRLALGGGKLPDDALVFPEADGSPRSPNAATKAWKKAAEGLGLTVSLHALRHTHASILIASGLDVLTISRRLGHGSPAITLTVYGHLFRQDDRAAQILEAAFVGAE
jgi:integrase